MTDVTTGLIDRVEEDADRCAKTEEGPARAWLAEYDSWGFAVFPIYEMAGGACSCSQGSRCKSPGKHPRTKAGLKEASKDPMAVEAWAKRFPSTSWAIRTGAESGIVVLDVDPRHGGDESLQRLEDRYGALPPTLSVETGGGGRHFYFRHPGLEVRNATRLAGFAGIDVRGDGGYVVAPPSNHQSGGTYRLVEPVQAVTDLPDWLLDLCTSRRKPLAESRVESALVAEGSRNDTLFRMASGLRAKGHSEEEILIRLLGVNADRCSPPLQEEELVNIARNVSRYAPRAGRVPLTDSGNAERLSRAARGRFLYCAPERAWYVWSAPKWSRDARMQIDALTKQVARSIPWEPDDDASRDVRDAYRAWAHTSESKRARAAMRELAQSEETLVIEPTQFDADPMRLAVSNGLLDLRTGVLGPADPGAFCTKASTVRFDPKAQSPLWDSFLDRIFDGDAEVIAFVQRAVGYSLTGDTSEEVLFLLHGNGRNGKTTFLNVVRHLVGDYAEQAGFGTFLTSSRDAAAASPGIAKLRGARLVCAVEANEGARFDEALVKNLTGRDPVSCRFLHANEFTYVPQYKIWLAANYRPEICGDDLGIWRRIQYIPFNVTIPERDVDPDLPAKLADESSGILNWALTGCLAWQTTRLSPPDKVRSAVADYKSESDTVGQFLSACTKEAPGDFIPRGELYRAYASWSSGNGSSAVSTKEFAARLRARGYREATAGRARNGRAKSWLGMALVEASSPGIEPPHPPPPIAKAVYPSASQESGTA